MWNVEPKGWSKSPIFIFFRLLVIWKLQNNVSELKLNYTQILISLCRFQKSVLSLKLFCLDSVRIIYTLGLFCTFISFPLLLGWILDWQFLECIIVTTFLKEWDLYKTIERLYLIILSKSSFCPTMAKSGFLPKSVINGINDPK